MRKRFLRGIILAASLIFSTGAAVPFIDGFAGEKYASVVYAAENSDDPESEEAEPVTHEFAEDYSAYDAAPTIGYGESQDLAVTTYTQSGVNSIKKPTQQQIISKYGTVKSNTVSRIFQVAPSTVYPYSIGKLDTNFTNSGYYFINFYRYVAGLGSVTLDYDSCYGSYGAQYGAVLLAASRNADPSFSLSHYPPRPSDMDSTFYSYGYDATSSSNISMRAGYDPKYSLQQSIYGCMNDNNSTQNLTTAGHRRWFLYPYLGKIGLGYAESTDGHSYMVSKIFDSSASVSDYDFISWPASGNFPNDIFNINTPWTITLNPSKFNTSKSVLNSAKITITRPLDGKSWVLTSAYDKSSPVMSDMTGSYFHVDTNSYGIGNCIMFQIGSSKLGAFAYSGRYNVKVEGLKDKNGNAVIINYSVDFFSMGEDMSKISDPSESNIKGTTVYNGVDYSKVYDYVYYLKKYPDLMAAFNGNPEGAIKHFVTNGMREGRQAKGNFDVNSYKNAYQDLRLAFGNSLPKYYEHYIKYGSREGRIATGVPHVVNPVTKLDGVDYSRVYDYNYYVNHNPDVKKAFGEDDIATLRHFINSGMREGRRASENFDVRSYILGYGDLRAVYGNNNKSYYLHYIGWGYREKRKATGITELQQGTTIYNGVDYSRVYNYTYYVNNNPDVKKAFGNNEQAVIRHFVNNGMREGRQGSAEFNMQRYKARYADLRQAFGNDNRSYYMHYIKWGYKEKRNGK